MSFVYISCACIDEIHDKINSLQDSGIVERSMIVTTSKLMVYTPFVTAMEIALMSTAI